MNHEQAFLEAIRRRPGSRADRLVYADWLMEQGDPRGEFIHCQIQARRAPRGSPRRLHWEARSHELLLAHEADWLGPMLGVIGNWDWNGGLLSWVTVAADVFLAHAESWLPALPLLGVHLRKARDHIAELARCQQLAHLSGLYLGDNKLTDDDLDVLLRSPYLKQIRSLYLQSNHISAQGIGILAQSPNLPQLRELCLGHNRLRDEAVALLASSRYLDKLRSLNLTMTGLSEQGVRTLAESALLSRLRILWCSLNNLPPGCLATLARAPAFAGLRVLCHELNTLDDADVTALANSPHATALRHLALEGFPPVVGDAGLSALANGSALGRLRFLSLGAGSWGAAGIEALGSSRTLTALRSLQIIADNEHGSVVAKSLLRQPLVRRLRHLNLCISRVDETSLAALATHTRPLRLRELSLPDAPNLLAVLEDLLSRNMLNALTSLVLADTPAGSLRALVEPGQLPELRRLTLCSVSDLNDFQALLDSPLLGRLCELKISLSHEREKQLGREVMRRFCAVWNTPALRRLELRWGLSADEIRLLAAAAPPPPALTELGLESMRMGREGMAALADSPLLRQLRRLVFHNSSVHELVGVEKLAESPHVGPLLRVDINNGHVPRATIPALRRRFGIRFAVGGRMWPKTITLGGRNRLSGDDED
jgi:uncharacterized protein (TIGR02996 family)